MAAGIGLALACVSGAATEYSPAQSVLFDTPHLANISEPGTLRYEYRKSGSLEEGFVDSVDMVVTEVLPDGRKNLRFAFLTGKRQKEFGAIDGFRGNPLIMLFLQRDVGEMSRLSGGAGSYFRNRIRHAFYDRAVTEATTFDYDGRAYDGTLVTLQPYLRDPKVKHFKRFEKKRYEFLMAPEVPGGIYRIRTSTPGENGAQPLLEESLTFSGPAAN